MSPTVAALRARRTALAAELLAHSVRVHESTVGAEVLALNFVDRFAQAFTHGAWDAFLDWIDRMCERHALAPANLRILAGGGVLLAAYIAELRLEPGGAQTAQIALADVIGRIEHIVARPRAVRVNRLAQTLDEVDATLDGLVSRLANFDGATADHSRAVSLWCARIGKKMSLTPQETTFVTRAGLIHDIGKVTTPREILNAPHRLSDPDMDIMRRHAEAGATIIKGIRQLEHLTPAVRAHHERIDGRGYPDNRSGSEIPLTARIVSVADSFNAMIGNRPYRLPMAPTLAIEQLRAHSGTQFDENVVRAMIDIVEHGG